MELPLWVRILESLALSWQAFLTPILVGIGGVFVWYKFIRQGEHQERLQPSVTIEAYANQDSLFVKVTSSVENIGNVAVTLDEGLTYLLLSVRKRNDDTWYDLGGLRDLFHDGAWIEPNEALQDESWHESEHEDFTALRAEIVAAKSGGPAWRAISVVSLLDVSGTITGCGEKAHIVYGWDESPYTDSRHAV